MSIRDDQSQRGRSRAELANAALQANRAAIEKLKSLYEIRVYSPGSAAGATMLGVSSRRRRIRP